MIDLIIRNYEQTRGEILAVYSKSSFYENRQQNEAWEIGFTVTSNSLNQKAFDLVEYEFSVFYNGQEFVIKEMTRKALGQLLTKQVVAIHTCYTIQDGYQYNTVTGSGSISQLLIHVFSVGSHGLSQGVIDPNKGLLTVEQESFGNMNYLKLINEILSDYNAVAISNNKHLAFYPASEYGQRMEKQIRYKYNTDEVSFDTDAYSLRTQIKGYGKLKNGANTEDPKDNDYVSTPTTYTSPESQKQGIKIQDPAKDEQYTVSGNMLKWLKTDLQDYPSISRFVILKWKIGPNKGNHVPFICGLLDINTYIQVVGIKTYPTIPNKSPEIILNGTKKTMTPTLAEMTQKGVT